MSLPNPYDPVEINDLQLAFAADALEYMPDYAICRSWRDGPRNWQLDFQMDWMFRGVEPDLMFIPRDDSWTQQDVDKAIRHLAAIQRSFAPSHEHKEAAIAFLIDQWFEYGRWKVKGEQEWRGHWPEDLDTVTTEEADQARTGKEN